MNFAHVARARVPRQIKSKAILLHFQHEAFLDLTKLVVGVVVFADAAIAPTYAAAAIATRLSKQ